MMRNINIRQQSQDEDNQQKIMVVDNQFLKQLFSQTQCLQKQYQIVRIIYKSQLSSIYLLQNQQKFYKVLKISSTSQKEIEFTHSLPSQNFIKPQKIINKTTKLIVGILMPYYKSNLKQIIAKNHIGLSIQNTIQIIKQIAKSIRILHSKSIVHGDLKPQNILYEQLTNTYYICDFGNSFEIYSHQQQNQQFKKDKLPTQTINYRAYEAIRVRGSFGIDIWSFGCVVYECLTGIPLISNQIYYEEELQCFFQQLQTDWKDFIRIGIQRWSIKYNQIFLELLYGTLMLDENKRWNIERVIQQLNAI